METCFAVRYTATSDPGRLGLTSCRPWQVAVAAAAAVAVAVPLPSPCLLPLVFLLPLAFRPVYPFLEESAHAF